MLANGFFVAAEFGLVAVDRSRVDEAARAGDPMAKRVQGLVENLSFHLSGAQLGITLSSLILGFIAKPTIARQFERLLGAGALDGLVADTAVLALSVVLAVAAATVFQMVVGELVPKTLAVDRPFVVSMRLSRAIVAWGIVARPIIATFDAAANAVVRRLGVEPSEELEHVRSLEEIERLIVDAGEEGELDRDDVALLRRTIRLGEKTAADALVPRVEVVALGAHATGADLVALATETGRSRFPVFGEDADDVLGVVHVQSIYSLARSSRARTPVTELMVEPIFIPETIDLDDLLGEVRASRNHLVIVVDEHGGTAGIITLEDILEEIVGEIDDEYDQVASLSKVDGPGSRTVSGSLHADELFDICGFVMPEGPYETLAGLVLHRMGRIPTPADRIEVEDWRLEVVAMDRHRIASVRLVEPAPPVSEAQ